jgi:Na+-transporting methylmalonyl-CoA/oxaloacetate decarboxylase gamma subunit
MSLMMQGLQVMLFGLIGVFAVLIIFYFFTKVMLTISKRSKRKG